MNCRAASGPRTWTHRATDAHLVDAAERVGRLIAEAMIIDCAPPLRVRVRLEPADWL